MTCIQEPIVETYQEFPIQKPLNYRQSCTSQNSQEDICPEFLRDRCFPMNFAKLLRTPILKNICEPLLLVIDWRTTQKLNHRDSLLLTCLAYINISVGSSFFIFYLRFLQASLYWFLKLNLQMENYMENFLKYSLKKRDCIFRHPNQIW